MESLTGGFRKWGLRLYNINCSPVLLFFLFFAPTPFLSDFSPCYFPLELCSAWTFPSSNLPQCVSYWALGLLMLGFPGINHRACTCWAAFSVSPVAPEGFFGLQSAFGIPCKILGLGGHLDLDGCVDKLFDHFPNPGLFSLPIPNWLQTVSGWHLGLKHSRPFGIRKKLSVAINEKEKPFPEFGNYVP